MLHGLATLTAIQMLPHDPAAVTVTTAATMCSVFNGLLIVDCSPLKTLTYVDISHDSGHADGSRILLHSMICSSCETADACQEHV